MVGGQTLNGRRPFEWGLLNGGEKRRRRREDDVFRPRRAIRKLQGPHAIKVRNPKCLDLWEGEGASPSIEFTETSVLCYTLFTARKLNLVFESKVSFRLRLLPILYVRGGFSLCDLTTSS